PPALRELGLQGLHGFQNASEPFDRLLCLDFPEQWAKAGAEAEDERPRFRAALLVADPPDEKVVDALRQPLHALEALIELAQGLDPGDRLLEPLLAPGTQGRPTVQALQKPLDGGDGLPESPQGGAAGLPRHPEPEDLD